MRRFPDPDSPIIESLAHEPAWAAFLQVPHADGRVEFFMVALNPSFRRQKVRFDLGALNQGLRWRQTKHYLGATEVKDFSFNLGEPQEVFRTLDQYEVLVLQYEPRAE